MYFTVKFCDVVLVLLYPVTISSVRSSGVFAPADAYVTVYFMLLFVITLDNSSLYVP